MSDKILDLFVRKITETNLNALDRTLAVASQTRGFMFAALSASSLARSVTNAAREIGLTLPQEQRATRPFDPWQEIAAMNPWCVCR